MSGSHFSIKSFHKNQQSADNARNESISSSRPKFTQDRQGGEKFQNFTQKIEKKNFTPFTV